MRKLLLLSGGLACLLALGSTTVMADTLVSSGKTYTASVAASASYPDTGGTELTNGTYDSTATYTNAAWQGRTNTSYYHTIDLGSNQSVNRVITSFMQKSSSPSIVFPSSVTVTYSTNGSTFNTLGTATAQALYGNCKKFQWCGTTTTARYIRITVNHSSSSAYVLEDEIEVWSPSVTAIPSPIYGVTVDHVMTNTSQIVTALNAMTTAGVKPTVRIVIDPGDASNVNQYAQAIAQVKAVAYVMAQPVDSYFWGSYASTSAYTTRFQNCYIGFGQYVDIWEIGNEFNGDWIQADGVSCAQVVTSMNSAYNAIKAYYSGYKTFVTPFMVASIPDEAALTVEQWIDTYITSTYSTMKSGINYVMVDFYEENNPNGLTEPYETYATAMTNMVTRFPNASVGQGECGFPTVGTDPGPGAAFNARVDKYYHRGRQNAKDVGGYFWWMWQEDCLTTSGSNFLQIKNDCVWMKTNF